MSDRSGIRPPSFARPLIIAIIATLISSGLFTGIYKLWHGQSLAQAQSRVQRGVSEVRAQLEAEFYGNINLATRLAAFVATGTEIGEAEFSLFARQLLDPGQHAVRFFALAREGQVRYIHPLTGNQAQLGRAVAGITRSSDGLEQPSRTLLSGPHEPYPGDFLLVVHEPVLVAPTPGAEPLFVGRVDMPIEIEQLLRRADIYRFAESFDLAIRVHPREGEAALSLFGRNAIFSGRPVSTIISLPGIEVELAATPHGGWSAVVPVPAYLGPLALLLMGSIFLASYRIVRQRQLLRASEAEMREVGTRLSALLAAMPNLVTIFDRDARCTALYGGQNRLRFHVRPEEVVGRDLSELLPTDKANTLLSAHRRALRSKELQTIEFNIAQAEAEVFADTQWPEPEQWFKSIIAPLLDADGNATATLWVTDNVTETRHAQSALQRSENRYRQLTNAVQQVIFEVDANGRLRFINPAWARLATDPVDDPVGRDWTSLLHPDDRAELAAAFRELIAGRRDKIHRDTRLPRNSATPFWVSAYLMPIPAENGHGACGAIGTLFDIDERKRSESAIRHQALHDGLTGLPNRLLLIERLDQALARVRRQGKELAVLFVDLDDFKAVNDRYGHLAGDRVLQTAAHRLREQVRDTDTVARIGGDEFVVLLDSVSDPDGVHIVASKLVNAMSQPVQIEIAEGRVECRVGASIGVALAPRDGTTVDTLLHQADRQLYQAKADGKGVSRSGSGPDDA